MKHLYKTTALLMVLTALIVWFVPGVDAWVEALFMQAVAGAAR